MNATLNRHHVVVVGAGFGGLETVRALAGAPVRITMVDRRNHHLFRSFASRANRAVSGAALADLPMHSIRTETMWVVHFALGLTALYAAVITAMYFAQTWL